MTHPAVRPWGLTRMEPFPAAEEVPFATVVLDPRTQTGLWLDEDGLELPALDKHRRSNTSKETKQKTSLDGNKDEGSDQESDND